MNTFRNLSILLCACAATLTACDDPNSNRDSRTTTPSNTPGTTAPNTNTSPNTTAPNTNNNSNTTNTAPRNDTTSPQTNTGVNKRDASGDTKTPMDQSNAKSDIDITAAIRKAVVDNKSMSTNAQNCKIITDKGVVTLRGVVDSRAEKDAIERVATATPGVVRVINELEIKTP